MRGEVEAGFRSSDGHQANNPAAVARVILELSDLGRPPNRLVIGHQALERAEAALETRRDLYRSHADLGRHTRSEEHTSELQSLMRSSYAVFCLKKERKSERSK